MFRVQSNNFIPDHRQIPRCVCYFIDFAQIINHYIKRSHSTSFRKSAEIVTHLGKLLAVKLLNFEEALLIFLLQLRQDMRREWKAIENMIVFRRDKIEEWYVCGWKCVLLVLPAQGL